MCARHEPIVTIGYPLWLRLLLPRSVVAITLGRRIRIARPLPHDELAPLLRHEMTHVRQMRERGVVRFLARYVAEYVAGRARGAGHDAAYRGISFEREAFAAETGGVELAASTTSR